MLLLIKSYFLLTCFLSLFQFIASSPLHKKPFFSLVFTDRKFTTIDITYLFPRPLLQLLLELRMT
jgi:hypothetical protein